MEAGIEMQLGLSIYLPSKCKIFDGVSFEERKDCIVW
jgi:hypothetical protein